MLRSLMILSVVPLGGCLIPFLIGPPCGGGECPEPEPVRQGLYEIVDADPALPLDGELAVDRDVVLIRWTDEAGDTWEAEYSVSSRFPE